VSVVPRPALAALFAACLLAPRAVDGGGLAGPTTAGDRITWRFAPAAVPGTTAGADSVARAFARGDSLAGWRLRVADRTASPVALREYARQCLALGDTAAADSALGSPRLAASAWAWQALRLRTDVCVASGDSARAESLLAVAVATDWPEGDRAARVLQRARLAAAAGRIAPAEELARQVVRIYPSLGQAGPALALLDTLAIARGDSLSLEDERIGAEVDFFRGARGSAARRLRHARPREIEPDRWKLALRLAEVLRASRMPKAARAAAETALALAPAGEARVRADLERARAIRDGGETDDALAAFARIGRSPAAATLRATAWWEYAREAEDESRWPQALEGLRHVALSGERRADDARLRAGLVQFAHGQPDSARYWWRASTGEAAKFWLGLSLRATDRAQGDSVLAGVAALPGYGYYRAAARESLGTRGWRFEASGPDSAGPRWKHEGNQLLDWGLADDAMLELSRSLARSRPGSRQWLQASAWAYEAGRFAAATRWAESAFAAAESDSAAWAIVPWAYPPAFEAEVVAAETLGIDRTLLWALIRQESRFDPRARSRSDALGLTQLKVTTAGDAAGWLREPKPREETLFAPDTSVRFGARYLARMLQRYGGVPSVALAAYNAGPGTIRDDWRALLERGGEALYAEFASNADSQDYVKRILGFRQAYREMRPTLAP
jgi:soluble lytic murein transglycosylase-like protein